MKVLKIEPGIEDRFAARRDAADHLRQALRILAPHKGISKRNSYSLASEAIESALIRLGESS